MLEVSIYNEDNKARLSEEIKSRIKNPVFMCIGTEKVFSDSLGPRVGTLLNAQMDSPSFVYGICSQNITAENLEYCYDFIREMHPENEIVVIDAAVGTDEQIGNVQICSGGIVPGAATNKNLPEIGDLSIIGIVAQKGLEDFYTLNSEKEKLVNEVASFIVDAIISATKSA